MHPQPIDQSARPKSVASLRERRQAPSVCAPQSASAAARREHNREAHRQRKAKESWISLLCTALSNCLEEFFFLLLSFFARKVEQRWFDLGAGVHFFSVAQSHRNFNLESEIGHPLISKFIVLILNFHFSEAFFDNEPTARVVCRATSSFSWRRSERSRLR